MEKIKIDKAKNEVLVSFNKKFYKQEFINQAVLDFKRICNIEKVKGKIILKPKEQIDINVLGYEFYNYVLDLMKNK